MTEQKLQVKTLKVEPRRFYAIGDIHGCNKELSKMLDRIVKHGFSDEDVLVFLGDYVDRGPDSKDCIQQILDFKKDRDNVYCLMGNHEDMMLGYCGWMPSQYGRYFLNNGGGATMKSYCSNEMASPSERIESIPAEHKELLCNLYHVVSSEKFYFVHANVDFQMKSDDPTTWRKDTVIWDRDFQFHCHSLDKTIIHGHTPARDVTFNFPEDSSGVGFAYNVDVDSGCVFGFCLSCLVVDNEYNYEVIQIPSETTC